jgi:hypothetical protein
MLNALVHLQEAAYARSKYIYVHQEVQDLPYLLLLLFLFHCYGWNSRFGSSVNMETKGVCYL